MRPLEIMACGLGVGAIAAAAVVAALRRRHARPREAAARSVDAASPPPQERHALPPRCAPRKAPLPHKPPLWVKVAATAYLLVLIPVYWRRYGPGNFLWFSDLALAALYLSLWVDTALPAGMAAVGVLPLEIAWSADFLSGGRLLDLTEYMFDTGKPRYLRALSLFHLAMPPAILWMLRRRGYDRRSLPLMTVFGWGVMAATYGLTDPEKNINWVFGPGSSPQHEAPPLLYLAGLMAGVPLVVYLPTHLVLARAFDRPEAG